MQQNRGVDFILGRRCLEYLQDNNAKVNKVILRGKELETDHIVYFPNNFKANTDYLRQSYYNPDMKFDTFERLMIKVDMNANINKVFAAGEMCCPQFFRNRERIRSCSHGTNINQGMVVGFNIMGLGIPFHYVPYEDYELYGHKFKDTGCMSITDRIHTDGDPYSFNFTTYFANKSLGVLRAAGIQSTPNHMAILREAIRTNVPIEPDPTNPILFSHIDISEIEYAIRQIGKSGCYKQEIWEQRYDPVYKLVLWDQGRMRMGDTHYSFWEHGRLTPAEKMRREDQQMNSKEDALMQKLSQMSQKATS